MHTPTQRNSRRLFLGLHHYLLSLCILVDFDTPLQVCHRSLFAMFVCLFHHHALLGLLLSLTLCQQIIARTPINPLSYEVFSNSFNLYDPSGKGGCNRNAPNGAPMLQRVQMSLGGAWALSQTVANDLPNYSSQTYIRGLLFLFFGITFQENHELNPDGNNVNAFNFIAGMVQEKPLRAHTCR